MNKVDRPTPVLFIPLLGLGTKKQNKKQNKKTKKNGKNINHLKRS